MAERPAACTACRAHLERLGIDLARADFVVALAGNPNTGKSTVFNALTGLRQHVGNWPGKTVTRAEGGFELAGTRYKLVDLPGTYSLLSASTDEEIARNFVLFGRPDCVVVVVDATALERNLNVVLQILQVTDRVVVCLNLMDEAARKGIRVDHRGLARDLGVPVVPTAARTGEGLGALVQTVAEVARGETRTRPRHLLAGAAVEGALDALIPLLERAAPGLPSARWVATRLLDGDGRVEEALGLGELSGEQVPPPSPEVVADVLDEADRQRRALGGRFRDEVVEAVYEQAAAIAGRAVRREGEAGRRDLDALIDRLVTSRLLGLPIMLLGLAAVFWITIIGANHPSQAISAALLWFEDVAASGFEAIGAPSWLVGFLWHGVWRGLAWVVSVMLPPMAIFFPLFTILENLGYLPRVAFNMDWLFRRVGAHGKQALTMSMGFGCNAAGVIACRVIDSPRERLVAILTNNFVPCNGRFPTLIMLATVFVAAEFSAGLASLAAAAAVIGAVLLGIVATLAVSWVLSRTVLAGEASSFTLELPPYRRPNVRQILYTSLIDRTLFVLRRAVVMAAPAGGLIWILNNVGAGGESVAGRIVSALDPLGSALGLDGVILLAYIVAIPANEIVVPAMLMTYMGSSMLIEPDSLDRLRDVLVVENGWTLLTGICLMVFCVLHNPCSTTILTIWRETLSRRWTLVGALLPLALGVAATLAIAQLARLAGAT
ncbi:MAG: ferrous iron transport protein B [Thermoleophilia bacterium]|nr:ferrous iron transport protein B [Thermoleophilia bacterium]